MTLTPHGSAACLRRIASRDGTRGDDFALDPATAAAYFDGFEPPTAEEEPLTVLAASRPGAPHA